MNSEPSTINVYLDNLDEEEREKFLALVEKANKPETKTWIPVEGELWYKIIGDGCTESHNWYNNDFCWQHYAIGNCFKTKAKAEFAIEKLKVIAELRRIAEKYNEVVDDTKSNRFIYELRYDKNDDIIYVHARMYDQINQAITFSSSEISRKAIDCIGEQRLKKYYFEVQEEQND